MKPQDLKNAQTVSQEQSDVDFLSWLETTLIPDLFESEQHCLIEDFQRLLKIIERLDLQCMTAGVPGVDK